MRKIAAALLLIGAIVMLAPSALAVGCAANLGEKSTAQDVFSCLQELETEVKKEICAILHQDIVTGLAELRYKIMATDLSQLSEGGPIVGLSRLISESGNKFQRKSCEKTGIYPKVVKEELESAKRLHNALVNYATKKDGRRSVVDELGPAPNKSYVEYRLLYGALLHLSQQPDKNKFKREEYWTDAASAIKNAYKLARTGYNGPRKTYIVHNLRCAKILMRKYMDKHMVEDMDKYITCMNAIFSVSAGPVAHLNIAKAYAVQAGILEKNQSFTFKEKQKKVREKLNKSIHHFDMFSRLNTRLCKLHIERKASVFGIFKRYDLEVAYDTALENLGC